MSVKATAEASWIVLQSNLFAWEWILDWVSLGASPAQCSVVPGRRQRDGTPRAMVCEAPPASPSSPASISLEPRIRKKRYVGSCWSPFCCVMEGRQGGTKTPSLFLEVELGPPFQTYAKPGAEKAQPFHMEKLRLRTDDRQRGKSKHMNSQIKYKCM